MFIPKENRVAVFSYLFREGVLVVSKNPRSSVHPEIDGATNLEVMMLAKSLASRGFVRQTFSWQHTYCYLTDDGIAYLRRYLALPESVVPATHKKTVTSRPQSEEGGDRKFGGEGGAPSFRGDREGRGEYRRDREGGLGRGGGV
eukprot:CAMPEP_0194270240 /NCGR_PEP_ID=MMETSP0169-20130528/4266_1 /TAXON_ID=218684 /ORGANISM="Corethron pennatum, Strain L29A3" /LENGTH=143 /DNA_ID=CAMNT_0039012213 /DNA_START=131 /DNA_END=562 /DNA_ORIENTATION=+